MRNLASSQRLGVAELLLHPPPLVHPQCCYRTVPPDVTPAGVERGNVHRRMQVDAFILPQSLRATVSYPVFLVLDPAIVPTSTCQSVQGGRHYHFTGLKKVQVLEVEPMQEGYSVLHPVSATLDDLFLPG